MSLEDIANSDPSEWGIVPCKPVWADYEAKAPAELTEEMIRRFLQGGEDEFQD